MSDEEVEALILQRIAALQRRDFVGAGAILGELQAKGIWLEDSQYGTGWRREVSHD